MWKRAILALPLWGCAPATPHSDLPVSGESAVLHGAVLLPLTVRSSVGLLGHVWSDEERRVERSRLVLKGKPRRDETRQHVEVLGGATLLAKVGAGYSAVEASASAEQRTDVAYSVDITSYETLDPDPSAYLTDSSCCLGGQVAAACESGYVGRVLRGSGKLRYLRRLTAEASVGVGPVLHASGGESYELLDETTFVDAFFAFNPEPLDSLCSSLSPEQEMGTFQVNAAANCSVRLYTAGQGSKLVHNTYYPSADACLRAAERICAQGKEVVSCPTTYRAGDGNVTTRDLLASPLEKEASTDQVPAAQPRPAEPNPYDEPTPPAPE